MNLRLGHFLLIAAMLGVSGCGSLHSAGSTTTASTDSNDEIFTTKFQSINLPGYGPRFFVRILQLSSGTFITDPGCGCAHIDVISRRPREVVFKINKYYGLPFNLATGQVIPRGEAIGKEYRVTLKGKEMVSISEVRQP